MKTFKLLTTIFLTLFLLSCSEETDIPADAQVSDNELEGTWKLTEISQEGSISIQSIPVPITSEGSEIDGQIIITQNPNNLTPSGVFTNTTTIKIPLATPITQVSKIDIENYLGSGSWILDKGSITVTGPKVNQLIDITEFNSPIMKLSTELEIPILYQGNFFISNSIVRMTLVKQ